MMPRSSGSIKWQVKLSKPKTIGVRACVNTDDTQRPQIANTFYEEK